MAGFHEGFPGKALDTELGYSKMGGGAKLTTTNNQTGILRHYEEGSTMRQINTRRLAVAALKKNRTPDNGTDVCGE